MAAMLGSDLKSRMAREVRQLAQTPPEGVKYVETDADALTEVHADLTGPEGTPHGAAFRLKLVIGEFPSPHLEDFPHEDLPPERGDERLHLREHVEEGLEAGDDAVSYPAGHPCLSSCPSGVVIERRGGQPMTSYEQWQRAKLMTPML